MGILVMHDMRHQSSDSPAASMNLLWAALDPSCLHDGKMMSGILTEVIDMAPSCKVSSGIASCGAACMADHHAYLSKMGPVWSQSQFQLARCIWIWHVSLAFMLPMPHTHIR